MTKLTGRHIAAVIGATMITVREFSALSGVSYNVLSRMLLRDNADKAASKDKTNDLLWAGCQQALTAVGWTMKEDGGITKITKL